MPARRLRAAVVLLVLGVVTTVLLLSDRAQGWYRVGRRGVLDLLGEVGGVLGIGEPDRSDIPIGAEAVGHVVLFGVATVVVGFVFRRRSSPSASAVAVLAASAAFEVLQGVLSETRSPGLEDVGANGLGVLAGVAVLLVLRRIGPLWRSRSLAW